MKKIEVTYDDGIERAIVLVSAFRPPESDQYSNEYIQSVFKVIIEALKAEKLGAID